MEMHSCINVHRPASSTIENERTLCHIHRASKCFTFVISDPFQGIAFEKYLFKCRCIEEPSLTSNLLRLSSDTSQQCRFKSRVLFDTNE